MTRFEIEDKFGYGWEYWIKDTLSAPIEKLRDEDFSRNYESDWIELYKLENGKFAIISLSGCSCVGSSDADVKIYENEVDAQMAVADFIGEHK